MLGLVASLVLRGDDCIKYHLGRSYELDVTTGQLTATVRNEIASIHESKNQTSHGIVWF